MNDIGDPALQRRFERLERLFALTEPRCFAEHALLAMFDAAEARRGYVVLHPEGGAPMAAAVRGRDTRRIRETLRDPALATAVCRRLAEPAPVTTSHGPSTAALAEPIGPAALLTVRVEHGEAHCLSLWVIGRETPFDPETVDAVRALAPAVANLGALMLPRLPGGVSGFYARRALATRCDGTPTRRPTPAPDPLDGLPRIAADCARLAARGYTNKQIAGYLLMAESVVARYLTTVYRHLEIETRYQLDAERLLAGDKPAPRTPLDPLSSAP